MGPGTPAAGRSTRGGLALALLSGIAGLLLVYATAGALRQGLRGDWVAFYAAGKAALAGRPQDLYDAQALFRWEAAFTPKPIRWLYPPAYALAFAPLASLPPTAARLTWLALSLAAILAAARIARTWSGRSFGASLLALAAFLPTVFTLSTGQMTPVTLLLFTAIAAAGWRRTPGMRSGLLAGAVLYKPQLLVPLVVAWAARRRGRPLLGLALVALAVLGLSLAWSAPVTRHYLLNGVGMGDAMRRHLEARGAAAALGALIGPWAWAVSGVVLAALVACCLRAPARRETHAMLWLAPLIVSPHLGTYELLLVALPASFLAPLLGRHRLLAVATALTWFAPLLWLWGMATAPVVACTLLYGVCAWSALRTPGDTAAVAG